MTSRREILCVCALALFTGCEVIVSESQGTTGTSSSGTGTTSGSPGPACTTNLDCAPDAFCTGSVICTSGHCVSATEKPAVGTACGSCGQGTCSASGVCNLATCGCASTLPDGGLGYVVDPAENIFCNGPDLSDTTPNACRTNCQLPSCGDGVVDTGEVCDLGAQNGTGIGCNATCTLLGQVSTLAGSPDAGEVDGFGTAAEFGRPYGIAVQGDNLYVLDVSFKSLRVVELLNGDYVQTLAGNHSPMDGTCIDGNGSSTNTSTGFCEPDALIVFDGGLLITDYGAIRFFAFSDTMDGGTLSTFSGAAAQDGNEAAGFDAGPANQCIYGDPHGIALVYPDLFTNTDIDGVVAETALNADPFELQPVGNVGTIQEQGEMTTLNGKVYTSDSANPGNLYVFDTNNAAQGVQPVTFSALYTPPGQPTVSALNSPDGICTDGTSIYICETGTNEIKQYVPATGAVTLLAGGNPDTLAQLDGLGGQASFFDPAGCAWDPTRNVLYVSDRSGNTIRVIK